MKVGIQLGLGPDMYYVKSKTCLLSSQAVEGGVMLVDHQVQSGENESRVCWLVRKRLIDIAADYLLPPTGCLSMAFSIKIQGEQQ